MSESSLTSPSSLTPTSRNLMSGAYHIGPAFNGRRMLAMGNRPQDHRDRDLLLASLLRDRRLRMFRQQCINPPAWAPPVPPCIPANYHRRAQELIILGSMQQNLIEKMRDANGEAAPDDPSEKMLTAMQTCMPRGALFERTPLDLNRSCGHARLCPWCHARSVQRLYRQLTEGPCLPERLAGKRFVMLKTYAEAGEVLTPRDVRRARGEYRYSLRLLAGSIGIEGGVLLHQVTPWFVEGYSHWQRRKGFCHVFAMVGLVSCDEGSQELCERIHEEGWGSWFGPLEVTILSAETPHALRYLLFGTSYKFDSSELDIVVEDWRRLGRGIQDAAALEPWFLFTSTQAWQYVAAMHRTRLYDTFGNWRRSQAGQTRCSPIRLPRLEGDAEWRELGREVANRQRHEEAEERRRALAEIALPHYQSARHAGGRRPGSPALRKILSAAGHEISDRDARWLAENLRVMATRIAVENCLARKQQSQEAQSTCGCQSPVQQDVSVT